MVKGARRVKAGLAAAELGHGWVKPRPDLAKTRQAGAGQAEALASALVSSKMRLRTRGSPIL